MSDKLLPCPFCGNSPKELGSHILCVECHLCLDAWDWQHRRPDILAAPALSAQPAEQALAELVACKDLKDRLDAPYPRLMGEAFVKANEEYTRRKPLAWKAARAALAAPSPTPTKGD